MKKTIIAVMIAALMLLPAFTGCTKSPPARINTHQRSDDFGHPHSGSQRRAER